LLNRGGNKLDWFVRLETELARAPIDGGSEISVRVTIRNDAPTEGQPRYVVGPYPGIPGLQRGDYLGVLALTVPGTARDVEADDHPFVTRGPDGDNGVIGVRVQVPAGTSDVVTFRFVVPDPVRGIEVAPSARAAPIRYDDGERSWTDRRSRRWNW
jgi:hypothetical protein